MTKYDGVERSTATETFRAMLDERGVEWRKTPHYSSESQDNETVFEGTGIEWYANDHLNGRLGLRTARYEVTPEQAVAATLGQKVTGDTSDGYHTFNELYHHRAVLFSVIVRDHRELAWKSMRHHDGTMYDGMFIVGIETPDGQATYHYDIDPYWDMFNCKELDRAPEWDGHTPSEAIERIATLGVDLKAENAKLREEFDKMDVWHSKELSAAMAEIDKLRELVRDYERCTMHADCAECEYDGKLSTHCPLSPCFPDADELCELRIEVDG